MIKLENINVYNLDNAIRAMRNPLESWDLSDSGFVESWELGDNGFEKEKYYNLGSKDLELAKKLINAGTDHRKFLRQILVSMDIAAPLYWFKEFDTYKVGTTANSTSTMHTIHKKEFSMDMFSFEAFEDCGDKGYCQTLIAQLNTLRRLYLDTKDKVYWNQIIQLLPSSWNQTRTVTLNYEVLLNMYNARKSHKLEEWRNFCNLLHNGYLFPYFSLLCIQ